MRKLKESSLLLAGAFAVTSMCFAISASAAETCTKQDRDEYPSNTHGGAAQNAIQVNIGAQHVKTGKWNEAMCKLRAVEKLDEHAKRWPSLVVHLGMAHERRSELIEALEAYRRIAKLKASCAPNSHWQKNVTDVHARIKALETEIPTLDIDITGPFHDQAIVTIEQTSAPSSPLQCGDEPATSAPTNTKQVFTWSDLAKIQKQKNPGQYKITVELPSPKGTCFPAIALPSKVVDLKRGQHETIAFDTRVVPTMAIEATGRYRDAATITVTNESSVPPISCSMPAKEFKNARPWNPGKYNISLKIPKDGRGGCFPATELSPRIVELESNGKQEITLPTDELDFLPEDANTPVALVNGALAKLRPPPGNPYAAFLELRNVDTRGHENTVWARRTRACLRELVQKELQKVNITIRDDDTRLEFSVDQRDQQLRAMPVLSGSSVHFLDDQRASSEPTRWKKGELLQVIIDPSKETTIVARKPGRYPLKWIAKKDTSPREKSFDVVFTTNAVAISTMAVGGAVFVGFGAAFIVSSVQYASVKSDPKKCPRANVCSPEAIVELETFGTRQLGTGIGALAGALVGAGGVLYHFIGRTQDAPPTVHKAHVLPFVVDPQIHIGPQGFSIEGRFF
ncbi:MAG: hypothetical protein IPM54_25660 [Polyangiaceae bacterium]|nr:hypothetical protein [Polyangiaceae bacterium]